MPNCSEPTRLPITRTVTCTTGSGARGDCSSNCTPGTPKSTNLVNADAAPPGHGVVLWFQLDDFDLAVERARRLRAEIIEEPHVNPAPQHREIWLRDPDGYVVVVASPDGESGS
jgi:hypothetical protein